MKSILTLLSIILITYPLISITNCENSGIKFQVNTNIMKNIKNLPLSDLLRNTSLLDDIFFDNSQKFLNDGLKVSKLYITDIINPERIDTNATIINKVDTLFVTFTNFTLTLSISYIYENNAITKVPIFITFSSMIVGVGLSSKNVVGNPFKAQIEEIKLNGTSPQEISEVESFVRVRLQILQNTWSINLILGIESLLYFPSYLNYYNTAIFNYTNIDTFEFLSTETKDKINSNQLLFLLDGMLKNLQSTNAYILQGGIRGELYAPIEFEGSRIPEFPVNMNFSNDSINNPVTILLSDYTLNTIINTLHDYKQLHFNVGHDTFNPLTDKFDTDFIGKYIPRFKSKYGNYTKNVTLIGNSGSDSRFNNRIDIINGTMTYSTSFNLFIYTDIINPDLSLLVNGTIPFKIYF